MSASSDSCKYHLEVILIYTVHIYKSHIASTHTDTSTKTRTLKVATKFQNWNVFSIPVGPNDSWQNVTGKEILVMLPRRIIFSPIFGGTLSIIHSRYMASSPVHHWYITGTSLVQFLSLGLISVCIPLVPVYIYGILRPASNTPERTSMNIYGDVF